MSGGSYDYAYHGVADMADALEHRDAKWADGPAGGQVYDHAGRRMLSVEESAPILARARERRAWFAKLLRKVAKAMHDIEWVDSSDYGPGSEVAAIDAVEAFVRDGGP